MECGIAVAFILSCRKEGRKAEVLHMKKKKRRRRRRKRRSRQRGCFSDEEEEESSAAAVAHINPSTQ